MPTINLGQVRPVFKGEWNTTSTYQAFDFVLYSNKSAYLAIKEIPANYEPDSHPDYWVLFGGRGADGAHGQDGLNGEAGTPGPQGSQGPQGEPGPAVAITDELDLDRSDIAASARAVMLLKMGGTSLISPPVVAAPPQVAVGHPFTITMTEGTIKYADISKFLVQVENDSPVEVSTTGTATHEVSTQGQVGDIVTVQIITQDVLGNSSKPAVVNSEYITAGVISPIIVTPVPGSRVPKATITARAEDFETIPLGGDTHISTDWQLINATTGDLLQEDLASTDLLTHDFTSVDISGDTPAKVKVRFKGTAFGYSPWSTGLEFIIIRGLLTPSGRVLYRNATNDGVVVEWMDGSVHKAFVVAYAEQRTTNMVWGCHDVNVPLTAHNAVNSNAGYYLDGTTGTYGDKIPFGGWPVVLADQEFQALWPNSCDTNTAKQNCDIWMTYADQNNGAGNYVIFGVPQVSYARSKTINGQLCDIPNINQLSIIAIEADYIDQLDPTAATNPTKALGLKNPKGYFRLGSSTMTWSSSALIHDGGPKQQCGIQFSGWRAGGGRDLSCACIPIIEIEI